MDFSNKALIPKPNINKLVNSLAQTLPANILVDPNLRGKVFYCIGNLIIVEIFNELWHKLAHTVAIIIDIFAIFVEAEYKTILSNIVAFNAILMYVINA